jgi:hypothetical protein
MKIKLGLALGGLALVLCSGEGLAQNSPFTGTIGLGITLSTATPPAGTNFTADVTMDATGVTGTCASGSVPFVVGGYNLGVLYDNTKLTFVSAVVCPTAPAELSGAVSCNNIGTEVVCNNGNSGNTDQPNGGPMCLFRLTFTNTTATTISPAVLTTVHQGGPRSISSQLITSPVACAMGPATFPAANVTDFTTGNITPVDLSDFTAD